MLSYRKVSVYAKLQKCLYGLKQSGKLWYDNLTQCLHDFGCYPSQYDPRVFILPDKDGRVMYLCIHVDDLLIVASEEALINELHTHLCNKYGEVTRSDASTHLGIAIIRDEFGNISMSQLGLLIKIVEELGLDPDDFRESDVPILEQYAAGSNRKETDKFDQTAYQRIVGLLIYMCHSRPDFLFAVIMLSSHSISPLMQ
jgi:hypothetical protein